MLTRILLTSLVSILCLFGTIWGHTFPIDDCGILIHGVEPNCIIFESEHHGRYVTSTTSGYDAGDRVRAVGVIDTTCMTICVEGEGCFSGELSDCPYVDQHCGDIDGSGSINLADVIALLLYVFGVGPVPQDGHNGDVNCDGMVRITDAVYLLNYVFGSDQRPCDTNGNGEPDC